MRHLNADTLTDAKNALDSGTPIAKAAGYLNLAPEDLRAVLDRTLLQPDPKDIADASVGRS